jgi:hypothetical protein
MFVRALLIGFFLAAVFSSSAAAQCGSYTRRPLPVSLAQGQLTPIFGPSASLSPGGSFVSSSVPSLHELARQATDHSDARHQSCESHRSPAPERLASHRSKPVPSNPVSTAATTNRAPAKQWTSEELAASKFQAAHQLWLTGHEDAARRWLETVLRDYANTSTADRARVALARL